LFKAEQRGIQIGEQRGIQIATERINKLFTLLVQDGRYEDIRRSAADHDFQNSSGVRNLTIKPYPYHANNGRRSCYFLTA